MPEQDDITVGQLLLVEYQVVKEEQKTRIGFRDNLLYVTLTVLAAVIAASAQARQSAMLLALPPVCVVLGWTYLVNDEKISAIGAYVRGDLGPRLAQLAGAQKVFEWEVAHRGDVRRRSRKVIQCGIDLLAFCVVPLAGLLVYWVSGETSAGLVVLSGVEALTVVGLGVQIVLYARPSGRPAPSAG
ncbi:hypothetical protein [Streptomyces sp. 11x1]|uniref:hypothetical protein n=1 Tax=Streptomyces sp. 11x1 TaxID=3038642 RepID=UPI0029303437|nr:hypothetical protein [Streptomyces sp. 11x1]WNZ08608.1 hypothetical protein P8T65_14110 [Streptomyces sp. 11x1]